MEAPAQMYWNPPARSLAPLISSEAASVERDGSVSEKVVDALVGQETSPRSSAYDRCVEYANTRRTFGQAIGQDQLVQGLLGDMAVDLCSGHAMTMDCAARADAGQDVRTETALVDYHGTNAANRVFDKAIQMHGGMGFATETHVPGAN